jgi:hypothetical protein
MDEVQEDLSIMELKTGRQSSDIVRSEGRLYWEPRSTKDSSTHGRV